MSNIFRLLRSKEQYLERYFYHEYWSSKYVNWFYGSMLLLSPLCESGNDGIPSGEAHTECSAEAEREQSHHSSWSSSAIPNYFSPKNLPFLLHKKHNHTFSYLQARQLELMIVKQHPVSVTCLILIHFIDNRWSFFVHCVLPAQNGIQLILKMNLILRFSRNSLLSL